MTQLIDLLSEAKLFMFCLNWVGCLIGLLVWLIGWLNCWLVTWLNDWLSWLSVVLTGVFWFGMGRVWCVLVWFNDLLALWLVWMIDYLVDDWLIVWFRWSSDWLIRLIELIECMVWFEYVWLTLVWFNWLSDLLIWLIDWLIG